MVKKKHLFFCLLDFGIYFFSMKLWSDSTEITSSSLDLGQSMGESFSKGLLKVIVQTFNKPGGTIEKVPKSPQKDFLQDIYDGKLIHIADESLNELYTTKLGKAPIHASPLMVAVIADNATMVKNMLKQGAQPNMQNNQGITALHYATYYGRYDLINDLLSYNATLNIQDKNGMTPLMYSVSRSRNDLPEYFEIAKILLAAGADPNIENNNRKTSLWFAIINNDYEMVKLLFSYNAHINKDYIYDAQDQIKIILQDNLDLQEDNYPIFGI